ncbi:MAG: hypothetical protein IJ364_00285 [Oscillospiraceae bacterium]|nr:hypothetical protein [Oscillospiraceae bacterium]
MLKLLAETPVPCKEESAELIVDTLKCPNPKCITNTEQELPQVFKVVNKEFGICRCLYCETKEHLNK